MNKLSLPPRPVNKSTEAKIDAEREAKIEAIINKGGDVPDRSSAPQLETTSEPKIQYVNARLTDQIISQIDALRASRPRKIGSPKLGVSLRDWVVEAVMEKLERDRRKLDRGNK